MKQLAPWQISRRRFLHAVGLGSSGLCLAGTAPAALAAQLPKPGIAASDLPVGSSPAPLSFAHFPDRVHAFVWRNWQLVPARRMAEVLGARTSDVQRIGRAMGLGRQPRISEDQQARSHLTVIRRNWHLLPYEQLLALLGWSAEQLEFTLREDDFLFIKLGSLKPRCEPLRYSPPDARTGQREEQIARIVREKFANSVATPSDPLFGFVDRLSRPPIKTANPASNNALKFCYSYFALYGDPLLRPNPDPYPDGYLARLAEAGVTGVWLQGVLQKLAPFPWDPQQSQGFETRLQNLRKLVARARRHGIRVFLYLNEPRALPQRFYERHPELKGATEGAYSALCTSVPEVQEFLTTAIESICRAVPELGGFFTITASENLTNCWSHGGGSGCPRCKGRSAAEVIAEVNGLLAEGIKKARAKAELIAWDWGWNDAWAGEVIRRLPKEVALMSVSEWRLPIERGGIKAEVGEYSISAIGPGPRARAHWQQARDRGLKAVAKIQAGNTWELSSVPYIAAVENVARHAANLRQEGITGLMLGWTLGGYPSPNLEAVSAALAGHSPDSAMALVAERRFGKVLASHAVAAWKRFSAAFSEFPFHIGLVYSGPQQLGPANLLWPKPTGYKATMTGFPYDDLDAWRAIYPPEIFVRQFEKVAEGFASAVEDLKGALSTGTNQATVAERHALEAEVKVADAAAIHFKSAANQARFVLARRALASTGDPSQKREQTAKLRDVLTSEIELASRLHRLQSADSRIGFEASNQYFYVPVDLAEKVLNCRHLLDEWLPEIARS